MIIASLWLNENVLHINMQCKPISKTIRLSGMQLSEHLKGRVHFYPHGAAFKGDASARVIAMIA